MTYSIHRAYITLCYDGQMAPTPEQLEQLAGRLDVLAATYERLITERTPPGQPANGPTSATAAVWRDRLTRGRPRFVGAEKAPDANRRTLASVDPHLVHGVNEPEPADAASLRDGIAADQAKLNAVVEARRHLERAQTVLAERSESTNVSPVEINRRTADVRREASALRTAEAAAGRITRADIDRRQGTLDGQIDAHRERIAGAVLDDLTRAMPAALLAAQLQTAADRARDMSTES